MGLLDALQFGGNSGGGLLDFLRQMQPQQSFSGLQSDQAQYSPMNSMAQMPPLMQQPNAQMSPQQQPSAAPPQAAPSPQTVFAPPAPEPGGFGAGVSGFVNNLHTGPLGAVIGGVGSAMGAQSSKVQNAIQQANVTASFLKSHGVPDADIAAAVGNGRFAGNPEILKVLMANNVKEKQDYRPATADERKAAGIPDGQPLYIETNTNKPTFGPQQTNVNVSTEKTGQAELAKTSVEEYKTAQQASKESQKRLGMYDAFEKASQGFTPGATAEMRLTAKRYLKDAGLIKGEDVPDGEIQQMIGRQLAIHAQPKGQGAVSNYERQLYASSLPSMIQSPEGLKQAIGINRKLEQFDQNVAGVWRNSARENKGIPNYLDVQDKIAALGSPLSDADMAKIQPSGSTTAAPAGAAPIQPSSAGWTSIGNGVKIRPK